MITLKSLAQNIKFIPAKGGQVSRLMSENAEIKFKVCF